jgi:hypothetical protein
MPHDHWLAARRFKFVPIYNLTYEYEFPFQPFAADEQRAGHLFAPG